MASHSEAPSRNAGGTLGGGRPVGGTELRLVGFTKAAAGPRLTHGAGARRKLEKRDNEELTGFVEFDSAEIFSLRAPLPSPLVVEVEDPCGRVVDVDNPPCSRRFDEQGADRLEVLQCC